MINDEGTIIIRSSAVIVGASRSASFRGMHSEDSSIILILLLFRASVAVRWRKRAVSRTFLSGYLTPSLVKNLMALLPELRDGNFERCKLLAAREVVGCANV
jgi:hypothetical protein